MTFSAYWHRLTTATPQLADDRAVMRMTVPAFRAAIRRAYEAGGEDEGEPDTSQGNFGQDVMGLFNGIFGGGK